MEKLPDFEYVICSARRDWTKSKDVAESELQTLTGSDLSQSEYYIAVSKLNWPDFEANLRLQKS